MVKERMQRQNIPYVSRVYVKKKKKEKKKDKKLKQRKWKMRPTRLSAKYLCPRHEREVVKKKKK